MVEEECLASLASLTVDMGEYERLLRLKVYKVLRKRRAGRARPGARGGEVIVTEQEIDEEILKHPKDKKEEYKKLKMEQVWKKLYDVQYKKAKTLGKRGVGQEKVRIPEEMVIAEILREHRAKLANRR